MINMHKPIRSTLRVVPDTEQATTRHLPRVSMRKRPVALPAHPVHVQLRRVAF